MSRDAFGATVSSLIANDETRLVDFKREWYRQGKRGKGEMVKDVLALANTVAEGETGYLLFGVDDDGEVVDLDPETLPSEEAVTQILSTYANPVPRVAVDRGHIEGAEIFLLRVEWSRYQPHYATRDVDGVLSSDVVYARRGPTIGRLKLPEIESLIRAKDARIRPVLREEPLSIGFVETPHTSFPRQQFVFKIGNVSDQPIGFINAIVDTYHKKFPGSIYRQRVITNMQLEPGETVESEIDVSYADFYDQDENPIDTRGKIWHWWRDYELKVSYIDQDGVIKELSSRLSYER